ncbi:MAG: hypothetical protein ACJ72N_17030 [Labedaea sp.]
MTERDSHATDAAVVSDLRRATGRFPHDARLAELIRGLNADHERFAQLWATAPVATHREDQKTIEHPSVGPITVDCDVLTDADAEPTRPDHRPASHHQLAPTPVAVRNEASPRARNPSARSGHREMPTLMSKVKIPTACD